MSRFARRRTRRLDQASAAAFAAALGTFAASARADDLELDWSGRIQSDLRFRVEERSVGKFYDRIALPEGVERNQNLFGLKLDAKYGRFSGVAAIDFVLNGYSAGLEGLGDLTRYEAVQPYRFEPQALYLQAKDLFFDGLDLRVGHQIVLWGVGDQFNPTNNLNADDLRDPLLFGRQQANFMVKLDYWLTDDVVFSGVLVPIFKPALLPESAALGVAAVDRLPMVDATFRKRVVAEQALAADFLGHPTVVSKATPVLPEASADNMQFAYRMAGSIAEQDIALSYYVGRTDFPQPTHNHTRVAPGRQCDPDDSATCIEGLLETEVTLEYPRMHVWGVNMAGEVDALGWLSEAVNAIGYRLEAALVVPERTTIGISNDDFRPALPQAGGEYDYDGDGVPGGKEPEVVAATPFLKWVVGLDYTFGEHVYANAQWIHGMADEFGAGDFIEEGWAVRQSGVTTTAGETFSRCVPMSGPRDGEQCAAEILRPRLADYVALGVDLKFMSEALLLRLFTLWDVSGIDISRWDEESQERVQQHYSLFTRRGFSAVIFPELDYNFGNGLDLGAGALVQLGRSYTKFGDPAAGGSLVWTRGRFSF